jgi:glycosyltransferase involved in cell wall biosynthesis
LEQITRERGIEIVLLPHLVRSIRIAADFRAIGEIYRFLKTGEFDIVHTHSSKAGILGRVAARWAKVSAIVHTPHGHVFYGYFGPGVSRLYLQLERWAARFTDRIITLTHRGREEHLSRGVGRPEQYVTIPSGIPLDDFFPDPMRRQRARDALGIPPEAQVVGTVGRLTAVKDQKTLIQAVERLRGEHPGLIVLLIGDGELRDDLEEQVQRLHLQEIVRFLGWRPDVPDLLNALDLFVLCSLNEGMGRALVEAMATGLPAVATSVGGIPDLIEEDVNGCLVPAGDGDVLASAISRILNNPDALRAMGKKSRELSAEYNVDNMVRQLAEFYREIFLEKAA